MLNINDVRRLPSLDSAAADSNFLHLVRKCQTITYGKSDIIMDNYWTGGTGAYLCLDYCIITVHFYPDPIDDHNPMPEANGSTLDCYVWAGHTCGGVMTLAQIQKIFTDFTNLGYNRIALWTGYAPDYCSGTLNSASRNLDQNWYADLSAEDRTWDIGNVISPNVITGMTGLLFIWTLSISIIAMATWRH